MYAAASAFPIRCPRARDFPPIYRALIKAGEDSGDLARIMERLADYIEERNALRLIYGHRRLRLDLHRHLPAGYCRRWSAPSQARQELPFITQAMLAASEYVRQWGALNALVLVLLFGLWRWTQRAEAAGWPGSTRACCDCR